MAKPGADLTLETIKGAAKEFDIEAGAYTRSLQSST
jgi:hypothetical protein